VLKRNIKEPALDKTHTQHRSKPVASAPALAGKPVASAFQGAAVKQRKHGFMAPAGNQLE
jgi:hypothetical protein